MNPKISLVVPTYNVSRFIEGALDSVISQTLDPSKFEAIFVDDGSTDRTPKLIRDKVKGIDNVSFFPRNYNKGQSYSRDEAIKYAQGDYIALLDGDDILEPHALDSTLEFMVKNPEVQYSYSMHKRIDENGNFISDRPSYDFSKEELRHFNFVGHLKCFTKEIHNEIGGYDSKVLYAQDWDHVLRASEVLNENQISRNNDFLYRYRVHPNSISQSKKGERNKFIEGFLSKHLRKQGVEADVFLEKVTSDNYNYFNWREK